jgi:hypothetical protein
LIFRLNELTLPPIAACLNERREWWSVPARRFPPRWSVEELDAGFVVRDHNGQTLAL